MSVNILDSDKLELIAKKVQKRIESGTKFSPADNLMSISST